MSSPLSVLYALIEIKKEPSFSPKKGDDGSFSFPSISQRYLIDTISKQQINEMQPYDKGTNRNNSVYLQTKMHGFQKIIQKE